MTKSHIDKLKCSLLLLRKLNQEESSRKWEIFCKNSEISLKIRLLEEKKFRQDLYFRIKGISQTLFLKFLGCSKNIVLAIIIAVAATPFPFVPAITL